MGSEGWCLVDEAMKHCSAQIGYVARGRAGDRPAHAEREERGVVGGRDVEEADDDDQQHHRDL
jgi:hypothetical protein